MTQKKSIPHTSIFGRIGVLSIITLFALIGLIQTLTPDTATGNAGVRYHFGNMLRTCSEDQECGPGGFCQKILGEDVIGQCRGKYNEGTSCLKDTECRSLCCKDTCTQTETCHPNFRERIKDIHEDRGNEKKLLFYSPNSLK